jgi:hypothetical protein
MYYSDTGSMFNFAGGSSGNTDFPGRIVSTKSTYNRDGRESVLVFLDNGLLYEFGFDSAGATFKNVIRQNVGSVSHRATKQLENYNFVLDINKSVRGVGYEENMADIRASSRSVLIEDYLATLTATNACAEYASRAYVLALQDPLGAQNNVEIIYDELYSSWRLYTGHQANQYAIYQNKLVYASATDLNVYQYDSTKYQDAVGSSSVPIYFRYDTRGLDLEDPIRDKSARFIKVAGFISTGCEITVKAYTNGKTTSPIWTKTIDGDGAYVDTSVVLPWGSSAFATNPFASFGGTSSTISLRPFSVVIMCGADYFNDLRLSFENYQADVDFIITEIKPFFFKLAEERFPTTSQI